ncbi:MAG: argininosuccinate lyase [Acidimicrobiia bacterium]
MTLWQGRFDAGPSDDLRALNDSLAFDVRMFREDIAGSRAHARMLAKVGLLTGDEADEILDALDTVEAKIASGEFHFEESDEDIHTAVERGVTAITPAGAKLHTGRSRNDQVTTDLRLWAKHAIDTTLTLVHQLEKTLLARAAEADEAILPGYTHLQQAQPVTLAHHLLAHGWALARDFDRLLDARKRLDVSPLGAGALAGSTLPIDPELTAAELGFEAVFENSLDAVSDRDYVAETLFALSLLGVHLSRVGEELIVWSSTEFGYVQMGQTHSTGSSMMPQKANPDIAELARGKAGRLIGNLTGLLVTLKGLPLAYNKDLQEDKEPLFDSFDTIHLLLSAVDGMIATLTFDIERMAAGAGSPYLYATDLAEWLVARGTPFREAHGIVGGLVSQSLAGNRSLGDLVRASPALGPEAAAVLDPAPDRRGTPGGGTPQAVDRQMSRFEELVAKHESLQKHHN